MCRAVTFRIVALLFLTLAAATAEDWRQVGGTSIDLGLAGPASGYFDRVWYSQDGSVRYARTQSGKVYSTTDFEHWLPSDLTPPQLPVFTVPGLPEPTASIVVSTVAGKLYAAGQHAYRSEDGGLTWTNLTAFRDRSILGGKLNEIVPAPQNPEELLAAGANGIWRSMDGGASWVSVAGNLPNLPVRRIISVEDGITITAGDQSQTLSWRPGVQREWQLSDASLLASEQQLLLSLDASAVSTLGEIWYAGDSEGRLSASNNRGASWRPSPEIAGAGRILRIFAQGQFALAVTSSRQKARLLRTENGGLFWDDISGQLPAGEVYGATADRTTGATYVASARGVFVTYLQASSSVLEWILLRAGKATDVQLGAEGHQFYAAFDGLGVFATLAPHRTRDPRVVSAGDRVARAAAPGSLISVIGAQIRTARAGDLPMPILAQSSNESQLQLPFELSGDAVMLAMEAASGRVQIGLPLKTVAPAIFVDRDGLPLILNAENCLILYASTPARSSARLHILATGLGRVTPGWPNGLAAPIEDPPRVNALIQVYLDREPLEVSRATLAPGYIGLYLIEVRLPSIVNRGTSELYIEAADQASNRVRIFLEP